MTFRFYGELIPSRVEMGTHNGEWEPQEVSYETHWVAVHCDKPIRSRDGEMTVEKAQAKIARLHAEIADLEACIRVVDVYPREREE